MIFAIAPALLLVLKAAGKIIGKRAAEAEILGGLNGVAGSAAGTAIQEMVKGASGQHAGIIATSVAGTAFLFGAAGVFFELHGALNTIWKVRRRSRKGLVKGVFSISMVVVVTLLVIVSLVFDAGITDAGKYAAHHFVGGYLFWKTLQLMMSVAVATAMFALMFRFMPDAAVKWRDVAIAAAFTAVLFVLGKFALSIYLGTASVGSSFGAAGSIIVVLVWVYWSANIFLFGAEFAHVYATSDRQR
jgi:membrane protein